MKQIIIILILVIAVGIGGYFALGRNKSNNVLSSTKAATPFPTSESLSTPESIGSGALAMTIDKNKTYTAILHTTAGDITLELNVKNTPITANNFISLAKKDFYNNTIFHRVIKGFMIQGGDPNGNGTGGPGYTFADELLEGSYTRGTVAMANSGSDTNGSQFFIMHEDYPLDNKYVIFGKVISSIDVVDKIAGAEVITSASGENSKPVRPVSIKFIEIIEK